VQAGGSAIVPLRPQGDVATSGEEALAALARGPADLVLLDAMMPDMDGAEVLRRIRADAKTAALPVVIFSAVADPQCSTGGQTTSG
jgi:CheY-like chemotaxis protein